MTVQLIPASSSLSYVEQQKTLCDPGYSYQTALMRKIQSIRQRMKDKQEQFIQLEVEHQAVCQKVDQVMTQANATNRKEDQFSNDWFEQEEDLGLASLFFESLEASLTKKNTVEIQTNSVTEDNKVRIDLKLQAIQKRCQAKQQQLIQLDQQHQKTCLAADIALIEAKETKAEIEEIEQVYSLVKQDIPIIQNQLEDVAESLHEVEQQQEDQQKVADSLKQEFSEAQQEIEQCTQREEAIQKKLEKSQINQDKIKDNLIKLHQQVGIVKEQNEHINQRIVQCQQNALAQDIEVREIDISNVGFIYRFKRLLSNGWTNIRNTLPSLAQAILQVGMQTFMYSLTLFKEGSTWFLNKCWSIIQKSVLTPIAIGIICLWIIEKVIKIRLLKGGIVAGCLYYLLSDKIHFFTQQFFTHFLN